jgi:hypothetical protein
VMVRLDDSAAVTASAGAIRPVCTPSACARP